MTTVSIRNVDARRPVGKAGELVNTSLRTARIGSGVNADPQAKAIKTVTIDTYTDAATYSFTFEGRTLSYVATTADANQAGVAASFTSAINQDAQTRGLIEATVSGAVISLTSLIPGMDFSISESDAKLSIATTQAAASAEALPFGRVCLYGGASTESPYPNRLIKLPDLSDFSGPTFVLTPSVANATSYDLTVIGPDGLRELAAYTSDSDATAQEIVEGQKSALDGLSIAQLTAAEDDTALTVQLPLGYSLEYGPGEYSSVTVERGQDMEDLFAGITLVSQDEHTRDAKNDGYKPNSVCELLEGAAEIFVENSQGVARRDRCWLECADGADKGKLFNSAGATRVPFALGHFMEAVNGELAIVKLK